MNVPAFIRELGENGVLLWEEGGNLRYRAPKGAMTLELRIALRESKDAIVAYMREQKERLDFHSQPESRFEPFPLTGVQIAYLLGRRNSFKYGGVGCHGYGELIIRELDLDRLSEAWQTVIRRHDMLRAVVHEDGTQQVLKDLPAYEIPVLDFRTLSTEETASELEKVRAKMDHRVYEPNKWPLFDLRITLTPQQAILHFSIDLLIADFVSTQVLLTELHELIAEPGLILPAIEVTYRDYVLTAQNVRQSERYVRDRQYWLDRLDSLPLAPELPLLELKSDRPPRFRRQSLTLPPQEWAALSERACEFGITASTAVMAIFSDTISRWCRRPSFTLNVTLQNRLLLHPHVERLVGDFTSLELLAVEADPGCSFRQRACSLQARLWEDLDHQSFSGSEVMRELSHRQRDDIGLFPVVFTSSIGIGIGKRSHVSGLGDLLYGVTQTPQVLIDCQAIEGRRGLIINWDTRDEVFPPGLIEDMFSAFHALLERAASDGEAWNETDPVRLPVAQLEHRRLANATSGPLPDLLLHEGLVGHALRQPDSAAVITSAGSVSFGQLLGKALAVADVLLSNGAKHGDLVAVWLEKGSDQVVAVLGVLLAGCAYLPLDNDQPPLRRNEILKGARVGLALVRFPKTDASDWPASIRRVPIGDLVPMVAPHVMPPRLARSNDPAYVIYTSGSTGAPNGVVVSHLSAVNTISDINRRFRVGPRDRTLGLSSLGFDLSVYDIFGVLAAGGCLVQPDDCRRADPSHWAKLIVEHHVTLWNSVPALMQAMLGYLLGEGGGQAPLTSLRVAMLSGDWIPLQLPKQIRKLLPGTRVVSLGGATEAAIWSISYPIETVAPEWRSIPYGRPLTNQRFHVLDRAMRPCPEWVAGELYISGAGLAEGYLGDEAKTAERFIHHPTTGERLYRTGDWGRYLRDGSIEFLGREDRQVKIRGYRVELAEVEATISSYPLVGRTAVVADGEGESNRLVAFIEPATQVSTCASSVDQRKLAELALEADTELLPDVCYAEYMASLDQAALQAMLFALNEWQFFGSNPENVDRILSSVQIQHRRLVRRWIRALLENDLLTYSPDTGYYHGRSVDRTSLERAWQRVEENAKGLKEGDLAGLFRSVALRLPKLLRFGNDISQIISPDEQSRLVQVIYSDALPSKWAKCVVSKVLRHVGSGLNGKLRALELGAASRLSTGDTPALADYDFDLLLTDPSGWLLEQARERSKVREGLHFAVFEIDRPYRLQGLQPNSFDAIVACNTLHRARNIDAAIGQISELLSPHGWLIFAETTEDHYPIMTSLEVVLNLDHATGDFLDERKGRDQTFLSADQWREVILRAGGELVLSLPQDQNSVGWSSMRVFIARFKTNRIPLDTSEIAEFLTKRLPSYMMPAAVQIIDALPLTANSKVDYKLLSSWIPRRGSSFTVAPSEDRSDLERRIGELWTEALNFSDIGRDQDFLALGGDSLIAARLAGRLREQVPEAKGLFFDELLQKILQGISIAELAAALTPKEELIGPHGVSAPTKEASVKLRKLGGINEPVRLIVPDDITNLEALTNLTNLLSHHGTTLGLEMGDEEAYLGLATGSLIVDVAQRCVGALIDDSMLHIDVVAFGIGSALALEIARQMVEAGGIIGHLCMVGPLQPSLSTERFERIPHDNRPYLHSLQALDAWEPSVYAGDATILRQSKDSEKEHEQSNFWSGICLGMLRVVPLLGDDLGEIAVTLLDLTSRDEAGPAICEIPTHPRAFAG